MIFKHIPETTRDCGLILNDCIIKQKVLNDAQPST